jgi:hypothetical protein
MSKLLAAVIVALVATAPSYAADGAAQGAKPKKDRKICKAIQETGSRMGNLRACMTARQWREMESSGDWERSGEVAAREELLSQPAKPAAPQ